MLLQLLLYFDVNSAKHKAFENLTIKIENFPLNGQAKKENLGSKLEKKPLNWNENTEEENYIQWFTR